MTETTISRLHHYSLDESELGHFHFRIEILGLRYGGGFAAVMVVDESNFDTMLIEEESLVPYVLANDKPLDFPFPLALGKTLPEALSNLETKIANATTGLNFRQVCDWFNSIRQVQLYIDENDISVLKYKGVQIYDIY